MLLAGQLLEEGVDIAGFDPRLVDVENAALSNEALDGPVTEAA